MTWIYLLIGVQLIVDVSLRQARARLALAKASSRDALTKYTNCVESERIAEAEVTSISEQLDELGMSGAFPRIFWKT